MSLTWLLLKSTTFRNYTTTNRWRLFRLWCRCCLQIYTTCARWNNIHFSSQNDHSVRPREPRKHEENTWIRGPPSRLKVNDPYTASSIEMSLLVAFLFLQRAGISALPTLSPSFSEAPTRDPTFDTITTTDAPAERLLWNILWSCFATTFACTWVSVHPNIPYFRESKSSTMCWRLYFTFLSLIAPEIMILWAFKQLQGALVIMSTVNKSLEAKGGLLLISFSL